MLDYPGWPNVIRSLNAEEGTGEEARVVYVRRTQSAVASCGHGGQQHEPRTVHPSRSWKSHNNEHEHGFSPGASQYPRGSSIRPPREEGDALGKN